MGYEINWSPTPRIQDHPLYQKYSVITFDALLPLYADIKTDIKAALANDESAAIVNYLCWLARVVVIVA